MATIDDFSNIKISTSDLLVFQRELIQEKELLQNILTKIDDQISRLQVEQLHLLGLVNKSLKGTKTKSPSQSIKYQSTNDNQQDFTSKSLDLAVPSTSRYYEEEMEDEDD
ncbi:uncharacterized protein LOC117160339 [Bombus vancouverensis nearcticus]|uniref:uncharacterized protein LOC117160339 n=1 Tax=Bombus vancouverensis nearcticus TaxID=2705178 RepID=UPI00143B1FCB|nr:uncharacterized protein LOC117160339 isoform X1 [Bombus vancouverensis nearcticus]XP_033196926.1 uncharacterized protein LOC117160339 isoform X2 [Bombus vancouverensis nearcticus]